MAVKGFCSMKKLRILLPPLPPPPTDGMLVHHRVTTTSMSSVPIYTRGWSYVSCLEKEQGPGLEPAR